MKYDFVRRIMGNYFFWVFFAFSLTDVTFGQDINYSRLGIETGGTVPEGLKAGDNAPDFTGYDQIGKQVELKKLLAQGPAARLPVPATYIINRDGFIVAVQFDPDFRNRATVKWMLKNLGLAL